MALAGAFFLMLVLVPFLLTSRSFEPAPDLEFYSLDVNLEADATPANQSRSRKSNAVNPFSQPSLVGDHLLDLEMNDTREIISAETDVVENTFGAESPLLLADAGSADDNEGFTDGGSRMRGPWVGSLGGAPEFAERGGSGNATSSAAGKGQSPDANGPEDLGDGLGLGRGHRGGGKPGAGGGFVFLPNDVLTGNTGDSSVSTFPATNGLTILSDDADEGALGDAPGAPLSLDAEIELVHAPEPASLLLLGSGLVAIAHRLRKRTPPQ